jgi:methylmalonyl-CoA mutase
MKGVSTAVKAAPYQATNKVRFVTATALFDGHDASVNIMRRVLQASGAEVIHLGHNRSVQEIVNAALQEDVQGVAITSYQGGHVEFFKYMLDLLRQNGGDNIKVFGGGGGVIVPAEIRELMAYGVTRLYSPEDGAKLGLQGMIDDVIRSSDYDPCALAPAEADAVETLRLGNRRQLARVITAVENRAYSMRARQALLQAAAGIKTPPASRPPYWELPEPAVPANPRSQTS